MSLPEVNSLISFLNDIQGSTHSNIQGNNENATYVIVPFNLSSRFDSEDSFRYDGTPPMKGAYPIIDPFVNEITHAFWMYNDGDAVEYAGDAVYTCDLQQYENENVEFGRKILESLNDDGDDDSEEEGKTSRSFEESILESETLFQKLTTTFLDIILTEFDNAMTEHRKTFCVNIDIDTFFNIQEKHLLVSDNEGVCPYYSFWPWIDYLRSLDVWFYSFRKMNIEILEPDFPNKLRIGITPGDESWMND